MKKLDPPLTFRIAARILDTSCIGDVQTERMSAAISIVLRNSEKSRRLLAGAAYKLECSDPPKGGATDVLSKRIKRHLKA